MKRLSAKVMDSDVATLDDWAASEGLCSRSAAVRALIRGAASYAGVSAPRPPVADRDELLGLLSERARDGSVAAIRLLLVELRREDREPRAAGVILELAKRRDSGGAA